MICPIIDILNNGKILICDELEASLPESILFNKPVFVFNRHRHKVNSRMQSLMTLFGLNDCILTSQKEWEVVYDYPFNFSYINSIKETELVKSKAFIDNLLMKCSKESL